MGLFMGEHIRGIHKAGGSILGKAGERRIQAAGIGRIRQHRQQENAALEMGVDLIDEPMIILDEGGQIEIRPLEIGISEVEEHLSGAKRIDTFIQQIEGILKHCRFHTAIADGDIQAEILHQFRHRQFGESLCAEQHRANRTSDAVDLLIDLFLIKNSTVHVGQPPSGMLGLNIMMMIVVEVDEVNHQIGGYKDQIDDIDDQNIAVIMGADLGRDARDIAGDDEQDEGQAHVLGGMGLDILDDGGGPGESEADQHDGFQNFSHL